MSVAAALFLLSGGLRTLASSGISLRLARALLKFTVALGRFPKAMKNMVACRLPIFLSFENDGYYSSFSSVSVRLPPRFFFLSGGLPDTCVLGNLPQFGTGFVGIRGSLREIPEGDEKYSRWRSLFFYHSRMTSCGGGYFSIALRAAPFVVTLRSTRKAVVRLFAAPHTRHLSPFTLSMPLPIILFR